jgi:hypothetical protein
MQRRSTTVRPSSLLHHPHPPPPRRPWMMTSLRHQTWRPFQTSRFGFGDRIGLGPSTQIAAIAAQPQARIPMPSTWSRTQTLRSGISASRRHPEKIRPLKSRPYPGTSTATVCCRLCPLSRCGQNQGSSSRMAPPPLPVW